MSTVQFTVAEIKLPPAGKERGTIVTTDGRKYGCFREKFGLFQNGGSYEAEVTDGQYTNIVSAKLIASPSPPAQQQPAPIPQLNGNGNGHHAKDEQIFVQGVLQALIRAGEVKNDKSQLFHSVQMLRLLYQHTFGNGSAGADASRPRLVAAE